jgi:MinD superfamily P-loop ATPase
MKQLVVLSGKGGTGKTSVTAAFAHLADEGEIPIQVVFADADVDAANLELVLEPRIKLQEYFWGGKIAHIDIETCSSCGYCIEVCRFEAIGTVAQPGFSRLIAADQIIYQSTKLPIIDPVACDGCAACVHQCPEGAISMQDQLAGKWFRSESRYGSLFHAALIPAQENSGKLVTLVKQHARLEALDDDIELVLVDGPPGIGCPVISATSGADLALIVAEPTAAGVHDMYRVLQTTAHFGVQALVCINKADIYPGGTAEIEDFCRSQGIAVVGQIPFDLTVTAAMVHGQPVTAFQPDAQASRALRSIWNNIVSAFEELTS